MLGMVHVFQGVVIGCMFGTAQCTDNFTSRTQRHVKSAAQSRIENGRVERAGKLIAGVSRSVFTEDVRFLSQQQGTDRTFHDRQRVIGKVAPCGV